VEGSVSVLEVRLEVDLGDVSREAFDGVCVRQHVDFLEVRDVWERVYCDDVSEFDSKVVSRDFVNRDFLRVFEGVVSDCDAHCFSSSLSFEEDGVSVEDLEFFHLGFVHYTDGVVVIGWVFDDESVWSTF